MIAVQHDLISLGRLAEILQASPGEIERAAESAGIEIVLRIDGRPFFSDASVSRLRDVLTRPEPNS